MDATYDVVVIGGGAAGLSGALALSRARRKVLVIDSGQPRNAPAQGVHVLLGHEGVPPRELLAAGRAEVTGYGGEIVTGTVTAAERLDGGRFRVVLADGSAVEAARLLVATGLVDELPPVPGLAGRWGREVLHCPYCHGWEVRDQAIGVVATSPLAVHQALLWRQWSDDVILFLHTAPEPGEEAREQLAARGITVVEGELTGIVVTGDRLTGVRLAGGREVPRQALAVGTRLDARLDGLDGLGLETAEQEMNGFVIGTYLPADAMGKTAVPGVYVAGNVHNVVDQVVSASAAGVRAGAAINADLVAEEAAAAVAARRAAIAAAPPGHIPGEVTDEEFWDGRYRQSRRIWSGDPNAALVREVTDLPPGTALDLGSGEGGDAIWLARKGWRVTAADISGVALRRAARHAEEAGVGKQIDWQRHDLGESFPEGTYDLVTACYLHSSKDMPRERILRRAAAAVAPGGVLLVAGHAGWPAWQQHDHPDVHFPTPQEVFDSLEPAEGEWEVLRSEEFERTQNDPDGRPTTRRDNVLMIRRR
ncbi:bifunctional NAD(P)/FAD-dependent oxidoreductase/class I SAM-dependent methyltransferase [Nonomuraea rubra]|uniref:Thioredoxin reductase/SAM-dependent methyltransferase n=1 Tax=Nonomuraea rubra TaxID=46180 RepID=A0A7X0NVT8_9ACTN|nr:bifunctional NAD(P)/FAD-dependent oxidoreductase/class I SAM-dependent methyltransferase [Nonomuraea rubra]MBB6550326.1 thioredoxin reductase/SAM-dependent methyltransferase [Nonomuraea rubra]